MHAMKAPSTPVRNLRQFTEGFACLALVTGLLLAPPFILAQQRSPAPAAKSPANFQADAGVLIESQEKALEMAKELAEKSENPRAQAAMAEVVKQMERALKLLEEAKGEPKKLESAVAAQQASYQALLKLAEREFKVNEKKGGKGSKGGEQGRQGQVDQLELKMNKNRYEEQKQAKAEPAQFYALWSKLIPKELELTGKDGGAIEVKQVWQIGDRVVHF